MCWLSDQKDFGIHHHIREKPCGALLLWTRGHTVGEVFMKYQIGSEIWGEAAKL